VDNLKLCAIAKKFKISLQSFCAFHIAISFWKKITFSPIKQAWLSLQTQSMEQLPEPKQSKAQKQFPPVAPLVIFAVLAIIIFGVARAYYAFTQSNHKGVEGKASDNRGNRGSAEYFSPFGFMFTYPRNFRPANDYMALWNGNTGQTLILTEANKDQESNFIDELKSQAAQKGTSLDASLATLPFFPDETVFINPIPGPFSDLERDRYHAADVQFRNDFEAKWGREYPTNISDIETITTKDGLEGIIYVRQEHVSSPTPIALSVDADIPYRPITLKLGVSYVPSLDFHFPISNSSSVLRATEVIIALINSLVFN
jgi:hypothetical protein